MCCGLISLIQKREEEIMKKFNEKVAKRVATLILVAVAAFSVMGCSVEKTVTTTETHTDADGNTTTTTTTKTTDNNGTTTTTETTEGAAEEIEDAVAVFENIPIELVNSLGWDVEELTLKMSSSTEWSDNFLGDDLYIPDGETVTGINVTYDEIDNMLDIHVADSTGEGIDFNGLELPVENNDQITIVLECDEDGSYNAYIVE